ncbi:MAG: hypothetical protein HUN04_01530 [Desulfobacter sp.]|nr:MAG: hypothetical protein HUN04_01530 [Desulfobacter sp.]
MDKTAGLLIDDFRLAKKKLHRLFIIGLALALGAQFYVVEPYVSLKQREAGLNRSQKESRTAIKHSLEKETRLRQTKNKVNKELTAIRERINEFPDRLRRDLSRIRETLAVRQAGGPSPTPQQQSLSQPLDRAQSGPAIPIPGRIKEFSPAVLWYIDDWFNRLMEDLDRSAAAPLRLLAADTGISGADRLAPLAGEAVQALNKHIQKIDPGFWHSYGGTGGKREVAAGFRQELNRVFSPIETEVDRILNQSKKHLAVRSGQLKIMNRELEQIRKELEGLSQRISPLESTFGPIPLELKDLIRLFPFILSALVLTLSFRLNQVLRLRAMARELFVRDAPMPPQLVSYHLGGWLLPEPGGRPGPLPITLAGFFLLMAMFLRSAVLVGWHPELFGKEILDVFFSQGVYRTGLATALLLMLLAAAKALGDLAAESRAQAAPGRDQA